ncbi:MAG: phenylalanine--tRNA ligase subunit beta, partial [Clostridia bacterium]|nr:phenylalanine--tRNA ligase subunit beta [Clostridia bacterium]
LDEYIFDISITANRPDCQSVLGIAREVAAVLNKPLKMPATDYKQSSYKYDGLDITVEAKDLCPRYLGHGVRNITPGESPKWMKRNLALCGLRSISNVVDITNYVMLEIGQPMHAFDMETLESKKIIVRRAKNDESITTLDGKDFKLNESNLVICDGSKPVALAGIMGGLNSEITDNTTQLLFESAKFMRDNIRKTSRALGQSTDASSHYEKGISEYTCELGMARALHLIDELGCGEITSSEFDCTAGAPREGKKFKATFSGINRILGIEVPTNAVLDILNRLGFEVNRDGDTMDVVAPRYREDIEVGEPDLAEEVIREYGYNHITPTFLVDASVTNGGLTNHQKNIAKAKRTLCAQGFNEVSTLAFYADANLEAMHFAPDSVEMNAIHLLNPISSNLTTMRTTLAPSMLTTVVENIKRGNKEGRVFEVGNIYIPKQQPVTELPSEIMHIGFASFGEDEDFFMMKGAVESFGESYGLNFEFERATDVTYLHPGIAAYIICNGVKIGTFGKIANVVTRELDLPKDSKDSQKIFIGEIDYAKFEELIPCSMSYKPISSFPEVSRDLSLVVDEAMTYGEIATEIKRACKQVVSVNLFDIYRGKQIGEGKKSMSFNITFAATDKALEPAAVDAFIKKILGNLNFKLNIQIR